MINRGEQGEVDKFNKLLQMYQEVIDPGVADSRETISDEIAKMKDLFPSTLKDVPTMQAEADDTTPATIEQRLGKMKKT